MDVQPHSLNWKEAYKLMIGAILPRPIAFVSTIDAKGIPNLAPFSFFTAISAEPMLICFSPMRNGEDGSKKDTLINIEETKEFVINIVSEDLAEQMNDCAANFPADLDEFEQVGLTKAQSSTVLPPRVHESRIHLECVLHEVLHFGEQPGSGSLVIGKVQHIHVDDGLYFDGKIDSKALQPIGRLAGQVYTKPMSDTFELIRKKNER
ncbi:flavin reductase family protein [Jeotgalibacillus sp. S-D1]|uniref:flavin reductase family protein n=1 Tax=Jeotgalibacillus sp. S-D1 TaxID=2552189 RepID=UPI0010593E60|nr:flavin reductase family protein [Jeotgalibacillus sp. S-D1]TDL35259.1 flavin reductase family protein [Jeotgalibacillus sp. S-D1]